MSGHYDKRFQALAPSSYGAPRIVESKFFGSI
jgi:hypothetical protein